jgi:GntR family transcriptional regulator
MSEPMYRLIADDLRRKIESGELPPGARMKSEVELREEYGQGYDGMASRHTVRDAIKLLVSRGLVETRPGQGTFVVSKVFPFVSRLQTDPESGGIEDEVYKRDVEQQGRTPEETTPRVEVQVAAGLVARQLKLAAGTQVISRHQERRIDQTPWSMQTTFYPMEFVTERGATQLLMAENITEGTVRYLQRLGIKQAGWRDTIVARPPTGSERAFFGLSDKVQVAIFEFRRTGYDESGMPVRFTVTVYPADRNEFQMEAGRVPRPIE